eukprot:CAMPEP_0173308764 /NCGR_PEP_ID=MMETSP1143-20121109/21931_1 /TAXON_ID=483371 /ORGANISM="non described non described, Strain CCMP2298" /LENGTH=57 /DNA_ID=CAMNT_0014250231 /DNA_START=108 /DNA_END=278 /DNA_ORIENTATION=+
MGFAQLSDLKQALILIALYLLLLVTSLVAPSMSSSYDGIPPQTPHLSVSDLSGEWQF